MKHPNYSEVHKVHYSWFIYLLNSRGLKYQTTEIMSWMATMRARKLWTCQLSMPHWSVGRSPTSAGIRTSFHRVRRHLGQTPSALCQELLVADTHGSKCFQCHWKKSCGCRWVSCTCSFLTAAVSAALAVVIWHSAVDRRSPIIYLFAYLFISLFIYAFILI